MPLELLLRRGPEFGSSSLTLVLILKHFQELERSDGKLQRYFSQEIHVEFLKLISVTSGKPAIFEFEFFAIFCSIHVWRELLKGAQLVAYTDNDGIRDSLIACQTSSVNCEPSLETLDEPCPC